MKRRTAIFVCILNAAVTMAQNHGASQPARTVVTAAHGPAQSAPHKPDASRPKARPVVVPTPAQAPHAESKVATRPGKTPAPAISTTAGATSDGKTDDQEKPWSSLGKRDPFVSPVVTQTGTPGGCNTGKKCLEIGNINLRGIVHGQDGFIAVVSNGLNKAYFLRENDPVFNGYVLRITGDSIVFQETLQDRLGKTFTREVVKKISVPSV